MNLKQIRYFSAVADAGSYTAGARRAFVTQPTLSLAISDLESELGAKLFVRSGRGVALTPIGKELQVRARRVLREVEEMKTLHLHQTDRRLRIGILPTIPGPIIANLVSSFEPDATFSTWSTEDGAVDELRRKLSSGRFDLVCTALTAPVKGHRQIVIARDCQALALHASHIQESKTSPAILNRIPLIVRTHCEHLQAASRILEKWRVKPTIVARTTSDERALSLVAAGLGACLMPNSFAHEDVRFIVPQGVELKRSIGLEWIAGSAFDEAVSTGVLRLEALATSMENTRD